MTRRIRLARRSSLGRATAAAAATFALAALAFAGAAFALQDAGHARGAPADTATRARAAAPDRGRQAAPTPTTTVYVVRHAETAPDGTPNPPLSEAGVARARALRQELQRAGIRAIYATPYRRTQATALQLAEALELAVQTYEPRAADSLARAILERHAGRAVLVVGHSNTVPRIVRAFGGPQLADLDHEEYDAFFVVSVARDTTTVARLRYGARTRPLSRD